MSTLQFVFIMFASANLAFGVHGFTQKRYGQASLSIGAALACSLAALVVTK